MTPLVSLIKGRNLDTERSHVQAKAEIMVTQYKPKQAAQFLANRSQETGMEWTLVHSPQKEHGTDRLSFTAPKGDMGRLSLSP